MTVLLMGDSSAPPPKYPPYPVWAFYIGGDTPHVWTRAEIYAIPCRWVLPIFTASNPGRDPQRDAADIVSALQSLGWRQGECVAVDTETSVLPGYLAELDSLLFSAGYPLMDYESKGPEAANPQTHGGRWIADWTGSMHLRIDSVATQFANSQMTGGPWDASAISADVHLHELHPPVIHHITYVDVEATMPELARGDTGSAVRKLQALLLAWNSEALGTSVIDGIFGPDTLAGLLAFQRAHGATAFLGAADAETWEKLLTI